MRIRILILAGMVAWAGFAALSASAHAAEGRAPSPGPDEALAQMLAPDTWLRGHVTEADIELFFAYLRASLIGSAYGYDAPIPEALKRRAETLGRDLKRYGVLTGLLLLQAIEARIRNALPRLRHDLPPSTYRL